MKDTVIGSILGRIFAVWAAVTFLGIMLILFVPICISYLTPDPEGLEQFRRISRVWIHSFLFLTGCSIRRKGKENFRKGQNYIVIVNHNSNMDVPIATPEIPGPNRTIAKNSWARIPIFGTVYRRGSVLVDRKDTESRKNSYRLMKGVLAEGTNMCIYPEGSRNKTGQPLAAFQDGAFRLSAETGHAIVPALLFNTGRVLPRTRPFFFWPAPMEIHFLEPVAPEGRDPAVLKELLHDIMERYYVEWNARVWGA